MFDLIGEGLRIQQQALAVNNAAYTRIVRSDELLADVLFEAEVRGCRLWLCSEIRKAVICRNSPGKNYVVAHAKQGRVCNAFESQEGPEAA